MLSLAEIATTYENLKKEHERNLERYGVELPSLRRVSGEFNLRALQLVYLRHYLGQLVHRDHLSDFVRSVVPDASTDQQPRHLKYEGWDVRLAGKAHDKWLDGKPVPNGFNGLAQVQTPSPAFMQAMLKRVGRASATDWESLCDSYGRVCATCGAKVEVLEKGHKNPKLPDSLENLLPMCGACNNWANNDVVLNDKGRVIALASPKLVLSSDPAVQFEVFRELKRRFK